MRVNLKTYVYSSLEYWVTETYRNDWESCSYQIHRSFKIGWGAWENDRNEINSVDDQCIWLCIHVTSSIGKVLKLPDG